mgnify:CR=1 FL=1
MKADKKKIWLNGQLIEVSDAVYEAYMQGDRKIRYFESDLKIERVRYNTDGSIKEIVPSREDSLERLMDDSARQFADERESVEETVLRGMAEERLHNALSLLSKEDQFLITALFFEEKTERDVAAILDISQQAIHKRKNKILNKLKNFLEKF